MTLQIGYKNGQQVAYDPSDPLSSAGVTPAQSVQTETQTSTDQIVRGTTLQPAPPQTGTFEHPIGGTIEQRLAQEAFEESARTGQPATAGGIMQGIGTPPYEYSVGTSSALASNIHQQAEQQMQTQTTTVPVKTPEDALATGKGEEVLMSAVALAAINKDYVLRTQEERDYIKKLANFPAFQTHYYFTKFFTGLNPFDWTPGEWTGTTILKGSIAGWQEMISKSIGQPTGQVASFFAEQETMRQQYTQYTQSYGIQPVMISGGIGAGILGTGALISTSGPKAALSGFSASHPLTTFAVRGAAAFGAGVFAARGAEELISFSQAPLAFESAGKLASSITDISTAGALSYLAWRPYAQRYGIQPKEPAIKIEEIGGGTSQQIVTMKERGIEWTGRAGTEIIGKIDETPFKAIESSSYLAEAQDLVSGYGESTLKVSLRKPLTFTEKIKSSLGFKIKTKFGETKNIQNLYTAVGEPVGQWDVFSRVTSIETKGNLKSFFNLGETERSLMRSGINLAFNYEEPKSFDVWTTVSTKESLGSIGKLNLERMQTSSLIKGEKFSGLESRKIQNVFRPSEPFNLLPIQQKTSGGIALESISTIKNKQLLGSMPNIGLEITKQSLKDIASTMIKPLSTSGFVAPIASLGLRSEPKSIMKTGIGTMSIPKTVTRLDTSSISATKLNTRLYNGLNTGMDVASITSSKFDVAQITRLNMREMTVAKLDTSLITTMTTMPFYPPPPPPPPSHHPFLFPDFPDFKTFDKGLSRKMGRIDTRTRYKPSLMAVGEGIFAKGKAPKFVTGLGLRPIYGKRKRFRL